MAASNRMAILSTVLNRFCCSCFVAISDTWVLQTSKLHTKDENTHSPQNIFLFSLAQDRPHGLSGDINLPEDEAGFNAATYSVEWEVVNDNPPVPAESARMGERELWLGVQLVARVDVQDHNMVLRCPMWVKVLQLCNNLWNWWSRQINDALLAPVWWAGSIGLPLPQPTLWRSPKCPALGSVLSTTSRPTIHHTR